MAYSRTLLHGLAFLATFATADAALAAHPLQTEDAGTQGAGHVEWENGLAWTRIAAATVFTYQPQLSYGLFPSFDLIVQPSWRSSEAVSGWGDTNFDAKWRFLSAAPMSLAVRAGATLQGQGPAHGTLTAHALGAVTINATAFTVHANLGLTQYPRASGQRLRIGRASAAVMWAANEQLTLTIDGGAQSSPDATSSSWPGTLLAGAIYTLRPGIDLDIGYQSSVRAPTAAHEVRLGFTYRFAP